MKTFFTLLLIISVSLLNAQKRANVWYFGTNAGVNFNSGSPVAITGALNTWEGCASMSDKNTGQILFYTDGVTVYNKNHVTMTNGSGLYGYSSTTQSAVIVPKPG